MSTCTLVCPGSELKQCEKGSYVSCLQACVGPKIRQVQQGEASKQCMFGVQVDASIRLQLYLKVLCVFF